MRILFILKKQGLYGHNGYCHQSSGLFNSDIFVEEMLRDILHVQVKIVKVTDNNDIDRVVSLYRPSIVIIEALWVVPEKFQELHRLHPRVKWYVRLHSAMPFLAQESIAMDWIFRYSRMTNVHVGSNDRRVMQELRDLTDTKVAYLPNYYPPFGYPPRHCKDKNRLNIGCFGAIRPLKNQLIQAVAAVRFADNEDGRPMSFHMNGTRMECAGDPILRNIEGLFRNTRHKLVTYPWLSHHEFQKILRTLDVSMQVSLSETFNVVTADAVVNNVPIVVSPDIHWADPRNMVRPTDSNDIINGLGRAVYDSDPTRNRKRLIEFDEESIETWRRFLLPC